jgi:6-phosphogluconolactonase
MLLSGGQTPRKAYETLAAEPYRERFPWGSVHFWQADERFVPASDPRSNRRMIGEVLLSRAPVPRENFHGVDTDLPGPGEAARAYEAELRRAVPEATGGVPRLDAAVLGIGTDGHTASLFPGSEALAEGTALVLPATGGDPPVPRVTVTLPLLNAALRVVFVVQGEGKAGVLREVVAAFRDPSLRSRGLPATLVAPRRGTVVFLADAAAASRLPAEWRTTG